MDNLIVVTHAHVMQIDIDECKAVGVQAEVKGKPVTFRAAKEIVLSAGAINTPMLLERSGIGQPSRLEALGIPVHKALPGEGENLQDHWNAYLKQLVT